MFTIPRTRLFTRITSISVAPRQWSGVNIEPRIPKYNRPLCTSSMATESRHDAFSNPEVQKMLLDLHKLMIQDLINAETKTSPVCNFKQPEDLMKTLDLNIGNDPTTYDAILTACKSVMDHCVKTASPRFMNQLYSGINPSCLAGSWLTEILNTNLHTYEVAPVFVLMEKYMMKKLTSLLGFENGDGVTTPGGSFANMLGMHLARLQVDPNIKSNGMGSSRKLVLFTSTEAHYSIVKGASFLGFGEKNIIKVETDERGMMKADVLDQKLKMCKDEGNVPAFVMATTGSTVLGSCDDLNAIADVCEKHKIWMHVDAAWGGGVILSEKHKHLMNGVHRADSVAWNIHKMSTGLIQCSLFLVKKKGQLEECNRFNAEYLFQPDKHYDVSYDIGDKTIQCGRKVDIFKLWLMWRSRGDTGMAKQVENSFENAKHLLDGLKRREGFRVVLPEFQCPNICFWYIPKRLRGKEENKEWWGEISKIAPQIKRKMMEQGTMMIGYNPLTTKGYVNFFRVIITNPMATKEDMDFILDEMDRLGSDL
ncbi:cysteine sulfinic acid decarboxylase-like [Saccostrea echinata]|uniref:cysteine sulfinic acid decarboxylase-like n=1 Tax=Saccostrea echinata TaxID=191078 RepID=UPI002A7FAECB|nr:cysteine sulfinic acid decarboxylase-like [Saccostrea echinata]